jgi:hypothetical protein
VCGPGRKRAQIVGDAPRRVNHPRDQSPPNAAARRPIAPCNVSSE